VDTLDSKLQGSKQVSFLKVDVEGFELQVFRGAEQILEQHAPVILFECETRHLTEHTMTDVFAFLLDRGYIGSFFPLMVSGPLKISTRKSTNATPQAASGTR
jgi:hypothetical protein